MIKVGRKTEKTENRQIDTALFSGRQNDPFNRGADRET